MRVSVVIVAAALAACRASGQPAAAPVAGPDPGLKPQISAQLTRAADDWNRGDLDAFLSDYAAESTTTFVDGFRPRRGFAWIRENYAPRFTGEAPRDSLRFEEIEARALGPSFALVTARYILERAGRVTASGPFTLVMERRREGWRILHDHSSSDPR